VTTYDLSREPSLLTFSGMGSIFLEAVDTVEKLFEALFSARILEILRELSPWRPPAFKKLFQASGLDSGRHGRAEGKRRVRRTFNRPDDACHSLIERMAVCISEG